MKCQYQFLIVLVSGCFSTRANTYTDEYINVRNLTDREIMISVMRNEKIGVNAATLLLKPNGFHTYHLQAKILPGDSHESVLFKTSEWEHEIKINSFGYHLCREDFDNTDWQILPEKFYYYLNGDEYLLDVSRSQGTSLKAVPFSQQLTPIELKKGKYILTLSSSSGKKTVEVR